eukprot:6364147-Alexandrium_andersonii.AAC.1
MSASLVGSEMCIRDRCMKRIHLSLMHAFTFVEQIGCHLGQEGRAACKPVSYTHLTLPTICSV